MGSYGSWNPRCLLVPGIIDAFGEVPPGIHA